MTCTCTHKHYKAVRFGDSTFGNDIAEISVDGMFQFEIVNNSPNATIKINNRTVIQPEDSWSPPCNNVGVPFEGVVKIEFSESDPNNAATLYFIKGVECTNSQR